MASKPCRRSEQQISWCPVLLLHHTQLILLDLWFVFGPAVLCHSVCPCIWPPHVVKLWWVRLCRLMAGYWSAGVSHESCVFLMKVSARFLFFIYIFQLLLITALFFLFFYDTPSSLSVNKRQLAFIKASGDTLINNYKLNHCWVGAGWRVTGVYSRTEIIKRIVWHFGKRVSFSFLRVKWEDRFLGWVQWIFSSYSP